MTKYLIILILLNSCMGTEYERLHKWELELIRE